MFNSTAVIIGVAQGTFVDSIFAFFHQLMLTNIVENASEHGPLIDNMLEVCHAFMFLLFVGWTTFFTVTLFRFHHSRHPKADYHGVKTKASTHIEFVVVLVEAVLLLGFALPLWATRVTNFPKDNAVRVRVIAQQFMWNFHYPGPDGKFGAQNVNLISGNNALGLDRLHDPDAADDVVSPNDLHLPVGRNAILEIGSKDVIHSFSFQAMRIGQDAIPGVLTPIWFKPIKIGSYELICGQLCGAQHYAMRATVTVESQEDFDNWIKDQSKDQAPKKKAPAAAALSGMAPAPAK